MNEIPEEVMEDIKDFEQSEVSKNQVSESIKYFKNEHNMRQILKSEALKVKKMIQTEKQAQNGILPELKPRAVADIFEQHFYCIKLSNQEGERVLFYDCFVGIYVRNYDQIKRYIAMIEPNLNEKQAESVIYHIGNDTKIKPETKSRTLIPVGNGIYDLKQHKLLPFSHKYVFLTKIKTNYVDKPLVPNINGWTVDDWFLELAKGDQQIVNLFWEVISDSINGNFSRRTAIFLVSTQGSTGKGSFQSLIINLVGMENVATLKVNEFDSRFALENIDGKTVVIGDDIAPDIYIKDSSNFNSVVSGDPIQIEPKGKKAYPAILTPAVIQSSNGMPNFHNKEGTNRRLLIIPFNNHFEGDGNNWDIKDDYLKRDEVLQYVLYKALQLDFTKFSVPDASSRALDDFKLENDPVRAFIEEYFKIWELIKVPSAYVYEIYKMYCETKGHKAMTQAKFTRQLLTIIGERYDNKAVRYTEQEVETVKDKLEPTARELDRFNKVYSHDFTIEVGKVVRSLVTR
ncbi:phage/plasmid primase, P4 family [Pediococcus pentosaceus]|uniref:DNA primase family protein n=1 Tax=Pediococcus pentosaceus TaxID=1255 RepID=UPI0021AE62CB|nr:DNA primase family protein [Pediococcus pentosaceus]MDB1561345.1 phage/plasmid primase, P4 family [Pediococcus pentosaceus]WKF71189.1 phage/plasmid primase, P4 family [Pediococcus pentosaceus]